MSMDRYMKTSKIWTGLGWVLAVGFLVAVTTRLGIAKCVPQREGGEMQQLLASKTHRE